MKPSNRFVLSEGNVFFGPYPAQLRKDLFLFDSFMGDWLLLSVIDIPWYYVTDYIRTSHWVDFPKAALSSVVLTNLTPGEKIGSVPGVLVGLQDYRITRGNRFLERLVVYFQGFYVFEYAYEVPSYDPPEKMNVNSVKDFRVYHVEDIDPLQQNNPPLSKRVKVGLPPPRVSQRGFASL